MRKRQKERKKRRRRRRRRLMLKLGGQLQLAVREAEQPLTPGRRSSLGMEEMCKGRRRAGERESGGAEERESGGGDGKRGRWQW